MAPWFKDSWGKQDREQEKRDNDFIKERNKESEKKQMEWFKKNPPPKKSK